MRKKVLIIAKPWQGGLHKYYFNAFSRVKDFDVEIIFSYPENWYQYFLYKQNKKHWFNNLRNKINSNKYDIGFFINFNPALRDLENTNKNILYLTDKPKIDQIDIDFFSQIYISDLGYIDSVSYLKNYVSELPFGFDPSIHFKFKNTKQKKLICSIINQDVRRDNWLDLMNKNNSFPYIYGNYYLKHKLFFQHPLKIKPPVAFNRQYEIYANYEISLNIHANILKKGTNMRTFEASGCMVPQLIEASPGIDNYFEPDREILIFSSIEEYTAKLNLLKNNPKIRKKIALNAFKRANDEHSYDKRVDLIIRNL